MGDMADYYRDQNMMADFGRVLPTVAEERATMRAGALEREAREHTQGRYSFRYDSSFFPAGHPVLTDPTLASAEFHESTVAVVGLPYRNDDGTSRQVFAAELADKAVLWLKREPDNKFDPNAVEVWSSMWEGKLGYLPKGLAAHYALMMDGGAQVMAILEAKHMSKQKGKEHIIGGLTVRTGILGLRLPESGDSPVIGGAT